MSESENTAAGMIQHNREFRHFLLARLLYIMMLRMMGTVIGWQVYHITNDPLSLGLIGLAEVIPAVLFALYAGHIVDISDKRKMMMTTMCGYSACALVLMLTSYGWGTAITGKTATLTLMYGILFCTGIIRSFSGPSFNAVLAQLVPPAQLPRAAAASSATWLIASISGHALGGFMIVLSGYEITYALISGVILIAVVVMSTLQPKPPLAVVSGKTWESVKEGLRFVWNTKDLLGAMSLDLFAVLFGGAVALIPVFAKDILKAGPIGFGWLNAAADLGAIIVILRLTIYPLKKNQGKLLLLAVAGFGICMILFGLSKWYWLSFTALLLSGVLDGISIVVRSTIMQLKTPHEMRGRVSSVSSMFINSSNELGQFESGVMARLMGVVPSVVFGGLMTLLVVAITWFKAPTLKETEY